MEMKEGIPFKKMIFVCTNAREGEPACANPERGGHHLVELLRAEVKKLGLKGKVRVAKSGCMDVCASGPTVIAFDDQGRAAWYRRVSAADVPALVEKHFAPLDQPR